MARVHLEDVEMCSTVILKVISTKTKSIIVTYPVAMNTAVYTYGPKPSASLTIRFTGGDGRCAALALTRQIDCLDSVPQEEISELRYRGRDTYRRACIKLISKLSPE